MKEKQWHKCQNIQQKSNFESHNKLTNSPSKSSKWVYTSNIHVYVLCYFFIVKRPHSQNIQNTTKLNLTLQSLKRSQIDNCLKEKCFVAETKSITYLGGEVSMYKWF